MDRIARRTRVSFRAAEVDPIRLVSEAAVRGRLARRLRGHLRRMGTVEVLTPRWSAPQAFLEDLALDLAVGEPLVASRTVAFRPVLGRSPWEGRNFLLRILTELIVPNWDLRPAPIAVDRHGFCRAATDLLLQGQASTCRLALLAHGCENLPLEIVEDLREIWKNYREIAGQAPRVTMLLAGSVPCRVFGEDTLQVELMDFEEAEAAARFTARVGIVPPYTLGQVVRLSGGVPAMMEAMLEGVTSARNLPTVVDEGVKTLGSLSEELRAVVQGVLAWPDTADRFYELLDGSERIEKPEADRELLMVGLARRVRAAGPPKIALRAPLLAAGVL